MTAPEVGHPLRMAKPLSLSSRKYIEILSRKIFVTNPGIPMVGQMEILLCSHP